jgi:hypothetical protein
VNKIKLRMRTGTCFERQFQHEPQPFYQTFGAWTSTTPSLTTNSGDN